MKNLSLCWMLVLACGACTPKKGLNTEPNRPAPVITEVSDANLNATLWVQTASEYRALCHQAYNNAHRELDLAIIDPTWVAAEEQQQSDGLPPAVIVDVDETVLDNSPYQAQLVREGATFKPETWDEWVGLAKAEAVPGSKAFLNYAASRGVTVFYVTNRSKKHEEATRKNLAALGFPLDDRFDVVLLKGEREEWTSDKTTRRQLIAETHRILMMCGDDMGDFVGVEKLSIADRNQKVTDTKAEWGSKWIVLPNPLYGSWERALINYERGLTTAEKNKLKVPQLRGYR